ALCAKNIFVLFQRDIVLSKQDINRPEYLILILRILGPKPKSLGLKPKKTVSTNGRNRTSMLTISKINCYNKIFFTFVFWMKKFFLKITSFLLAFLVLLSTVSFTVEKHFCGSFLVDTALFSSADSCGMEVKQDDGYLCTVTKTSCCSDETILIQGQDT